MRSSRSRWRSATLTPRSTAAFSASSSSTTSLGLQKPTSLPSPGWLKAHGVSLFMRSASNIEVSATAAQASKLLSTRFHDVRTSAHGLALVRAASYTIPDEVQMCVAAIFGLHGRPLPPSTPRVFASSDPSDPALCQGKICVDPNLLATTYHVSGVKTTGSRKNRQAVAEFQGQLMRTTDLATLFKKYIKNYKVSVTLCASTIVHQWLQGLGVTLNVRLLIHLRDPTMYTLKSNSRIWLLATSSQWPVTLRSLDTCARISVSVSPTRVRLRV